MSISQTAFLHLELNHIIFFLVTLAIMEAVCLYLWRHRDITGAATLLAVQVARAFWILGMFFKRLSTDLPAALFWEGVADYASIFLAYLWCVFAMKISWQNQKPPLLLQGFIHALAGVSLLTVATNPWHGQYLVSAWLVEKNCTIVLGAGYFLVLFLAYFLVLLGSLILLRWVWVSRGWRRKMLLLLSLTPLFTLSGHALSFFPALSGYTPFVIASLLSELYCVWVYYRWRLFSILPFAQQAVIDNMIDGLLVIDVKGNIVDMNPPAFGILDGLPVTVGGEFRRLAPDWPALAEAAGHSDWHRAAVYRDYPYGRRHYQVNAIPLQNRHKRSLGKTIILKDISTQVQAQEKIIDQQKALAVLTERNRLGREIHDGQGQIWSYLQLEFQTLRELFARGQAEAAEKQAERFSALIRELNDDVRESIAGLKSTDADSEFLTLLQDYLNWYEKTYGISVLLTLPEEPAARLLQKAGEVQVLRIMQEALTNIRKHANARQVEVAIQKRGNQVFIIMADDGCGFDPTQVSEGKYGLGIMRERAEEAGCLLSLESAPGKGTKLTLTFAEVKDDGDEKINESITG